MSADILEGLIPTEAKKPDGPVLDFKIQKTALSKALSAVSSVVPNSDLMPVLKNFHLRLDGFDLTVTGSDSVLSVIAHADAVVSVTAGAAVFPADQFASVVSESEDVIHIRVVAKKSKHIATIKSGTASWTLPLKQPDGFPEFSLEDSLTLEPVAREGFLNAILRVHKAIETSGLRPFLELVDIRNGKARASDSNRFQQVKFPFPFDCSIPSRAVDELRKRLAASNLEEIEVGQTDNALLFRFHKTLLVAQKKGVKFPDMDEVLLKPALSYDQTLKVSRGALLKAVRKVRITAPEETAAIVLSLNHGSVSVESKDSRNGVAVETVEAEWEHAPRHVSFNHKQLSDMLSSTTSEVCTFRLGKDLKTKPSALLMEDEEEGFISVISQIRTDWT